MAMGAHVDRHVVDGDREVGAVVEIVAAQEVLVGFALAAVLGDDQARRRFEQFGPGRVTGRALSSAPVHRHLARHARLALGSRTHIRRAGGGYCLLGRLSWNGRKL